VKQFPVSLCHHCGFEPAKKSADEAKSFILSEQFRSQEELRNISAMLKEGREINYKEEELNKTKVVRARNMAIHLMALGLAILLGLLVGGIVAWVRISF
jgi:hypothetical protein